MWRFVSERGEGFASRFVSFVLAFGSQRRGKAELSREVKETRTKKVV